MRHPLVIIFIPFALGIIAAYFALDKFSTAFIATTLITGLAGLLLSRRYISKHYSDICLYFFGAVSLISVGALLCTIKIRSIQTVWPSEQADYLISIVSLPRHGEHAQRMDAEIISENYEGKLLRLYFPDTTQLAIGDELYIHTKIEAPKNSGNPHDFDMKGYLLQQGISGTGFAWQFQKRSSQNRRMTLQQWGGKVRGKITTQYSQHFEGHSLAILAAMTIGDKNELTKEVQDIFSQVGASHLLALSGLHLGILFSIFNLIFLRHARNRYFRAILSLTCIILIWTFAVVAGLPISLQRAALMFSIAQIMALLRRDAFSVNNLALSAIILLIINPLSLFDIGFQLSFASVLGILVIVPRIKCPKTIGKYKIIRFFYDSLCVTLSATIGTTPLVAYYFHNIPVYGIIVNLVLVFFAYGILIGALLFVALPLASVIIVPFLNALLKSLEATLIFFVELPGSLIKAYPSTMSVFLIYCIIVIILFARKKSQLFYTIVGIIGVFIIISESYIHRPNHIKPQIIFYNLYAGNAIHFINNEAESYLWKQGRNTEHSLDYINRTFWQAENITTPILLQESNDSIMIRNNAILFQTVKNLPKATDSLLQTAPHSAIFSFHKIHIVALTGKIPRSWQTTGKIDYLYVAKGFSGDPSAAIEHYSPEAIVMSSSLGEKYRIMWKVLAREKKISIIDLNESGAFTIRL